jgi:hypothetical protein
MMDCLLPGNNLIFHFFYSTSSQVWNPDRVFIIDMQNNIQPFLETVRDLPEEYLLTLENWLMVFTDNSLSLEDMLSTFSEFRSLASASEKLLPAGSLFLSAQSRCDIMEWHSRKILWELSSNSTLQDAYLPDENSLDPVMKWISSSDIRTLSWSSEQSLSLTYAFAKSCASATKNSGFLRLKKDQIDTLSDNFFEFDAMTNSHSLSASLMCVFSFVTGNSDFFFKCFEDPILLGRNPALIKKQNFYFLLTLLKSKPDAMKAIQIKDHFEPELSVCFPKDKLLLDLAFSSIYNPEECSRIFQTNVMNPLYVDILKQKMSLFYRMYLEGKQINISPEKHNGLLEEDPQRKNLYDGTSEEKDLWKNQFIDEQRLDENGDPIENGNSIVSGLDPKNRPIDDKFGALGEVDLRPAAIIDFESKLSGYFHFLV